MLRWLLGVRSRATRGEEMGGLAFIIVYNRLRLTIIVKITKARPHNAMLGGCVAQKAKPQPRSLAQARSPHSRRRPTARNRRHSSLRPQRLHPAMSTAERQGPQWSSRRGAFCPGGWATTKRPRSYPRCTECCQFAPLSGGASAEKPWAQPASP